VAKTPATVYFGFELRRAREAAGLSREDFGRFVGYAPSTIGAYETGERFPTRALATGADEHLKTGGTFVRMLDKLLTGFVYPESFRPWVEYEQAATALRSYESAVVPGLLQTEAYARALLESYGDDADTKLAARLERQAILERDQPPRFAALINEGALRQPVGGPGVMREQLRALAAAADRWIVQVVPLEAGAYIRLDGPFVIATVDHREVVFTPGQLRGHIHDRSEDVAEAAWRWDTIRSDALPRDQSKDLMMKLASSYE
jgi:transcriptional regulator with XRE-family HTH domain